MCMHTDGEHCAALLCSVPAGDASVILTFIGNPHSLALSNLHILEVLAITKGGSWFPFLQIANYDAA
jgi:hypothetical protein